MIARSYSHRDIIVVGAGPAGSVAALVAARLGAHVLLVDKAVFPRTKVCGSCLSAAALATLDALGLSDAIWRAGAVVTTRFEMRVAGHRASFAPPAGAVLARSRFDAALVRCAIAEGVEFIDGVSADIAPPGPGGRRVRLRTHTGGRPAGTRTIHDLRARVVIDATGLPRSRPRRSAARIGTGCIVERYPTAPPPETITMASAASGYVGAVALDDGRINIAAAIDPRFIRASGGAAAAANRVLADAGAAPAEPLAGAQWLGTGRLDQRPPTVSGPRLCRIGDAAGYAEPFTGEGIAWALAGGCAVAPLAVAASNDDTLARRLPVDWSRAHAALLDASHQRCRRITRLLRAPRVTGWAIRAMNTVPPLAALAVRCATGTHDR